MWLEVIKIPLKFLVRDGILLEDWKCDGNLAITFRYNCIFREECWLDVHFYVITCEIMAAVLIMWSFIISRRKIASKCGKETNKEYAKSALVIYWNPAPYLLGMDKIRVEQYVTGNVNAINNMPKNIADGRWGGVGKKARRRLHTITAIDKSSCIFIHHRISIRWNNQLVSFGRTRERTKRHSLRDG